MLLFRTSKWEWSDADFMYYEDVSFNITFPNWPDILASLLAYYSNDQYIVNCLIKVVHHIFLGFYIMFVFNFLQVTFCIIKPIDRT